MFLQQLSTNLGDATGRFEYILSFPRRLSVHLLPYCIEASRGLQLRSHHLLKSHQFPSTRLQLHYIRAFAQPLGLKSSSASALSSSSPLQCVHHLAFSSLCALLPPHAQPSVPPLQSPLALASSSQPQHRSRSKKISIQPSLRNLVSQTHTSGISST